MRKKTINFTYFFRVQNDKYTRTLRTEIGREKILVFRLLDGQIKIQNKKLIFFMLKTDDSFEKKLSTLPV